MGVKKLTAAQKNILAKKAAKAKVNTPQANVNPPQATTVRGGGNLSFEKKMAEIKKRVMLEITQHNDINNATPKISKAKTDAFNKAKKDIEIGVKKGVLEKKVETDKKYVLKTKESVGKITKEKQFARGAEKKDVEVKNVKTRTREGGSKSRYTVELEQFNSSVSAEQQESSFSSNAKPSKPAGKSSFSYNTKSSKQDIFKERESNEFAIAKERAERHSRLKASRSKVVEYQARQEQTAANIEEEKESTAAEHERLRAENVEKHGRLRPETARMLEEASKKENSTVQNIEIKNNTDRTTNRNATQQQQRRVNAANIKKGDLLRLGGSGMTMATSFSALGTKQEEGGANPVIKGYYLYQGISSGHQLYTDLRTTIVGGKKNPVRRLARAGSAAPKRLRIKKVDAERAMTALEKTRATRQLAPKSFRLSEADVKRLKQIGTGASDAAKVFYAHQKLRLVNTTPAQKLIGARRSLTDARLAVNNARIGLQTKAKEKAIEVVKAPIRLVDAKSLRLRTQLRQKTLDKVKLSERNLQRLEKLRTRLGKPLFAAKTPTAAVAGGLTGKAVGKFAMSNGFLGVTFMSTYKRAQQANMSRSMQHHKSASKEAAKSTIIQAIISKFFLRKASLAFLVKIVGGVLPLLLGLILILVMCAAMFDGSDDYEYTELEMFKQLYDEMAYAYYADLGKFLPDDFMEYVPDHMRIDDSRLFTYYKRPFDSMPAYWNDRHKSEPTHDAYHYPRIAPPSEAYLLYTMLHKHGIIKRFEGDIAVEENYDDYEDLTMEDFLYSDFAPERIIDAPSWLQMFFGDLYAGELQYREYDYPHDWSKKPSRMGLNGLFSYTIDEYGTRVYVMANKDIYDMVRWAQYMYGFDNDMYETIRLDVESIIEDKDEYTKFIASNGLNCRRPTYEEEYNMELAPITMITDELIFKGWPITTSLSTAMMRGLYALMPPIYRNNLPLVEQYWLSVDDSVKPQYPTEPRGGLGADLWTVGESYYAPRMSVNTRGWNNPLDVPYRVCPYTEGVLWNDMRAKGPHRGIDFSNGWKASQNGTMPIRPVKSGEVIEAKYNSSWGNYVKIQHEDNITSLYAHMHEILVSKKDIVTIDTILGTVGDTGNGNTHLHLEIEEKGVLVDPLGYVDCHQGAGVKCRCMTGKSMGENNSSEEE